MDQIEFNETMAGYRPVSPESDRALLETRLSQIDQLVGETEAEYEPKLTELRATQSAYDQKMAGLHGERDKVVSAIDYTHNPSESPTV